jgi:hypothetical protein
MVPKIEDKITVKTLGIIAGIVLTILGTIASTFVYIDNRYVHQDIFVIHETTNTNAISKLDLKTAQLITAMQAVNQQELNSVYKAIKDASALPLIVRRDTLLARGSGLSNIERDELNILERKLDELNIQD